MVNWLFKKYPRPKRVCHGCGGNFGLVRPHYPYCTHECETKNKKPSDEQIELPFRPPKKAYDVIT